MNRDLLKTNLAFLGTPLLLIPAAILLFTRNTACCSPSLASVDERLFWLGGLFAVVGIFLVAWSLSSILGQGEGAPALLESHQELVVRGPYRYVRNPIVIGGLFVLVGQVFLFKSWPLGIWAAAFLLFNIFYFPLVEEKRLEEHFGQDYRDYKANVPLWIPRQFPWPAEE